jgi:hypothetical protein
MVFGPHDYRADRRRQLTLPDAQPGGYLAEAAYLGAVLAETLRPGRCRENGSRQRTFTASGYTMVTLEWMVRSR